MPKILKSIKNPYALSTKQRFIIKDAVKQVSQGGVLDLVAATKRYYSVKSTTNARNITSQNLAKDNFREALVAEMQSVGFEEKMEQKLKEGLEATKITKYGEVPDYLTRLGYLRELHKIFGLYAPDKVETRSISVSAELTPEELDKRIAQLQEELAT